MRPAGASPQTRDIVKVVESHVASDNTAEYSVEVFNAVGETIAITAAPASALEAIRQNEVLSARML